jgi:tRNA/tmRNA/rRNA uracil-C5-methylase (TrmA/RlmC/RlmD family)
VERSSVEDFLRQSKDGPVATFIVDPPRTGMSREATQGIQRAKPARLVYVSCDVATLARDVRALVDHGYALEQIRAFDLFPNTAHVETIAVFDRAI